MSEQSLYRWDQAKKTFDCKPCCPKCFAPILEPEERAVLTRCEQEDCQALMEWVEHPQKTGGSWFWPRLSNENYSTLDGHKYQHPSPLDWCEFGGNSDRNGFIEDPEQHIFGKPTREKRFALKKAWSYELSAKKDVHSLMIMHGYLVIVYHNGTFDILSNINGSQAESFISQNRVFNDDNTPETFRFTPACRYPYVFLTNEKEVIIWRMRTKNQQEHLQRFNIDAELVEEGYHLIGSPTSFYYKTKLGFAFTLVNHKQDWKNSYLCFCWQDKEDENFNHQMIPLQVSLQRPMIYVASQQLFVGIAFYGQLAVSLSLEEIWKAPESVTAQNHLTKGLAVQIPNHHRNTVALRLDIKKQQELVVVHRHPNPNIPTKHLSYLRLKDWTWTSFPVKSDSLIDIHNISVGSNTKGRNSQSSFTDKVSITTTEGVYHFTCKGEPWGKPFTTAITHGIGVVHRDASIICGAGIINKVRGKLSIYWKRVWGRGTERHDYMTSLASRSGLAIFEERVFIVDTKSKLDTTPAIVAIDIVKEDTKKKTQNG